MLAAAPTPNKAARMTHTQLVAILRRAGRTRLLPAEATRLQQVLRADYLHQPGAVEDAMGVHALALLALLDAACSNADRLAEAASTAFRAHPDAAIIASFPGQGELTGARILGELGDDRTRFTDARGLKAYAGSAPITRASGRVRSNASLPPATSGPSPRPPRPRARKPTTTADAATETATSPPNATCSTDSSAACTTGPFPIL